LIFLTPFYFEMTVDPEIEAIKKCFDTLSPLDPTSQRRVVFWLIGKLRMESLVSSDNLQQLENGFADGSNSLGDYTLSPEAVLMEVEAGHQGPSLRQFDTLAAMLEATKPRKIWERVLVTSAWLQLHDGQRTLTANRINKELKTLEKGITNITQNIRPLVSRGLFDQLKADQRGRSRPVFRVSRDGLRYVRNLLRQQTV
jgi:hypothetical protein